ncbi:hypothetical protein [Arthrobacter globiformis]|nr:hypothetical protein [Arthrobacter globiformis]MDQ0618474.1 hypothetical protein [Arthrobacter globiformis]
MSLSKMFLGALLSAFAALALLVLVRGNAGSAFWPPHPEPHP